MGYEIDFLAVGEGERGGDAIAIRLWTSQVSGEILEQGVIVIDGGTKESGEKLVEHIKKYYSTNKIDIVISTHPDSDHSSGLSVVLEKMNVECLWMHKPWEHSDNVKKLFNDGRISSTGLEERLAKSLNNAYELQEIADKKGIPIIEPLSDNYIVDKAVLVLGPSTVFYERLITEFRDMPEKRVEETLGRLAKYLLEKGSEVISKIAESFHLETLINPGDSDTSAENNSSVIFMIVLDDKRILFTGDAGREAIDQAIEKAETLGIDMKSVNIMHVPHHGSKHNLGPNILDKLIGSKLLFPGSIGKKAYISAPADGDPKHPSGKIVNALIRRGAKVFVTRGQNIWEHSDDAPKRDNYHPLVPLSLYNEVEE